MLTEEQKKDVEFCKTIVITQIEKMITHSDKLKEHVPQEVLLSIVHFKIFRDYFKGKEFENLEEAWGFFRDDMKNIIIRIHYANQDLKRIEESIKNKVQ